MGNTVAASIISMAGLGLFFASVLAIVNQKLKVKEDPKIEAIEDVLPSANCGVCGFTGCRQYAEALVKGEELPDKCKAAGEEAIARLSEILGVEIEKKTKAAAIVHCGADDSKRKKKAVYTGIKTCVAAHNISGGENLCEYGCLGYGDCMNACPFGAIKMVSGLPVIDRNKCTACGKCKASCPRSLITVEKINAENFIYVACNNPDNGPETRRACDVGCIACSLCQKLTGGVFRLENNLAGVEYDRMSEIKNVEEVITKCPTKCIK
jgi:RnfABCDGE-type electron transport complex B subunit